MRRLASGARTPGITLRLAAFYGASFAAVGVFLPYWPVWLAAQGLSPGQIGVLLAALFWPQVVTAVVIPYEADRRGWHRRLMVALAAVVLVALALFAVAGAFWVFLVLSMVVGASRAAILPLGEAMVLREAKARDISYGRVRLWGSVTFMAAAVAGGLAVEHGGAGIVLGLVLATALLTLVACLQLPEYRDGGRPSAPPRLGRLLRRPAFLIFVLAAGLIQVSHAVYYGFATLYWRAVGYSEGAIGWLWAEGVLAETLLFAAAGALLRRLEPVRLLALAGAVTALRWSLSALSAELPVVLLAQSLHAISFGATHLAAMHYLRDQVPAELQASAQGFYAAFGHALPLGLVTPVAGWLYATSGGQAFWPMAALALAGSAISVALALRAGRGGTQ